MAKRVEGDVAAERAVLAGICKYGAEGLADVSDLIETNTFTSQSNQIIFRCLTTALLKSTVVDIPSLLAASAELGLYDILSSKAELEFIRSIFHFPIKLDNIRILAVKIKKLHMAKDIQLSIEEAHRQLSNVTGNESIDEILSLAETPIFNLSAEFAKDSDSKPQKLFADGREYLQHLIDNRCDMVGISSGFPIYDKCIGGGLRAGSVNLIVARPKQGKTTHSKTVAMFIAGTLNIPVLMLDTEMNKGDQINKSVASDTRILTEKLETGQFGDNEEHKRKAFAFMDKNVDTPYYYKNIAGKPFHAVLSIMRRWLMTEVGLDENGRANPCVVIYDYFKIMDKESLDKMQEYQAMGFQISELTDFATQTGMSGLAYVQANRQGINQETTDIISQSDRLLWLCGSCCFLRRKSQEEQVAEGLENGNTKIIPLECRYGPGLDNDFINMRFNGSYAHFEELTTQKQALAGQNPNRDGFDIEDEE